MIRPQAARWFEILAARDDATVALEALAATGAVELEARATAAPAAALAQLQPLLQQFAEFSLRYRAYWPQGKRRATAFPEPPEATLTRCLARIRAWAVDAEPIIQQLQRGAAEREEQLLWGRVQDAVNNSTVDLSRMAAAGPLVQAMLFVFPAESEPTMPAGVLVRRFVVDGRLHALAVGNAAELQPLAQQAAALKGQVFEIPAWLRSDAEGNAARIAARLETLAVERARLLASLETVHERHDLRATLGDAGRLQWIAENVRTLEAGDLFCWLTGWTSELTGHRLSEALEQCGARALLRFAPPPPGAKAPLILANPRWARPFEIFSRALGMPSRDEADPTTLLAVAVPLMFGYMFGDVGQGLVIAAAGFALRNRWPLARLFMSGGIAASAFGLLFGSVFSLDHVLSPLWLHPLDDPLAVLLAPLFAGAVLLTVGLVLSAVEAYWRHELRGWFCSEVWLAVVYVSLLVGIVRAPAFAVAAAGALLFCAGRAVSARSIPAGFAAIAELIERTVQILINTLSFVRVGAFALAHAGLSSAIVALMDASESIVTKALVLVAGNVIVLVLEGMVVAIQTTRLVLFEFFTRFLVAQGRYFRPLPTPPTFA